MSELQVKDECLTDPEVVKLRARFRSNVSTADVSSKSRGGSIRTGSLLCVAGLVVFSAGIYILSRGGM
jgi:hypothetical protein